MIFTYLRVWSMTVGCCNPHPNCKRGRSDLELGHRVNNCSWVRSGHGQCVRPVDLFLFDTSIHRCTMAARCCKQRPRRVGGVEVGIADKKWGSNAACACRPRTRKSVGLIDPWTPWLRGPWK